MTRFVTVAAYLETFRADIARSALEDAGIKVNIADREIVAMEWIMSNAVGGIKVQVPEEDAVRAREILDEIFRNLSEAPIDEEELARQALAAEPESEVEPASPARTEPTATTESEHVTPLLERDEYARRFMRASFFSLCFFPLVPFAVYLFLVATFGSGTITTEGWRRILSGVISLVCSVPLWLFCLMPMFAALVHMVFNLVSP